MRHRLLQARLEAGSTVQAQQALDPVLQLEPLGHQPLALATGPALLLLRCARDPHHRADPRLAAQPRSEEHTSELQSLMRISYAVFCLKKKNVAILLTRTTELIQSRIRNSNVS